MKDYKVSAIICAAGKGERAQMGKNKLLAPFYGAPALWHTLKKFATPYIDEVIVTSSENDFKEISALCAHFGFKCVIGGTTRTQSVKNGLKQITGDIVLIHDGARPYVTEELIINCIDSVKRFSSGVCAVRVTDTTTEVEYGEIKSWLDRNSLWRVQTPQAFFTEDIIHAYELAGEKQYTDDSAVFGEFIAPPRIVEGDENNIKLTFKSDFTEVCPPLSTAACCRIGFGVDVHAFGNGNSVKLAGVEIQCDRGLIAHSDGDVVFHAVMDALLSAAGLKDIGNYFPDSNEKYRNADSGNLLEEVIKKVNGAGYVPINLSISVQAEKPKLAPHVDKMIKNLSKHTGVTADNIAVAAGTCEHLGFVGEGAGIAAYCSVLLNKADTNGKNN